MFSNPKDSTYGIYFHLHLPYTNLTNHVGEDTSSIDSLGMEFAAVLHENTTDFTRAEGDRNNITISIEWHLRAGAVLVGDFWITSLPIPSMG